MRWVKARLECNTENCKFYYTFTSALPSVVWVSVLSFYKGMKHNTANLARNYRTLNLFWFIREFLLFFEKNWVSNMTFKGTPSDGALGCLVFIQQAEPRACSAVFLYLPVPVFLSFSFISTAFATSAPAFLLVLTVMHCLVTLSSRREFRVCLY